MNTIRAMSLLLALLLLVGCAAPALQSVPSSPAAVSPDGRAEFDAFCSQLNATRRENLDWTPEELATFQAVAPVADDLLTEEEVAALLEGAKHPPKVYQGVVSAEAAQSDVELFFRALKSSYGAYDYFGGDAVFYPLRDGLLQELSQRIEWRPAEVAELLRNRLSPVVQDGHFAIGGGKVLARQQVMFTVPGLYFDRDTAQPAEYVRPTIGLNGEITYCFAALTASVGALPATGTVAGKEVRLKWQRAADLGERGSPIYAERTDGQTPGFICRSLKPVDQASLAALEQLAANGARWYGKPLFTIDLRGNSGGNARFGSGWISNFAGRRPTPKLTHFAKDSALFRAWSASLLGSSRTAKPVAGPHPGNAALSAPGSTVFVLQYTSTGSAGESFVFELHGVENTVFVGSNTAGCTMMGNLMSQRLPRTGIMVDFGANISFIGTTDNIEGRGHLPDLWVPPAEAEAAIERLIDYYDLR